MARSVYSLSEGGERPSAVVYFIVKVYSVAANTFVEAVRQPVFAVIVLIATALIVLSPYLTMFTLQQSPKFLMDTGLATVMLAGLLLAAFTASSVISEEIENRTALTVIAKPVGRTEFILGKFLGVVAGLIVATYLLTLALVLSVSGGAMEAQLEQELSLAVALSIFGSMFLAVCYGVYCNFFADRPFTSRAIGATIPLFTVCFLVFCFLDPREMKLGGFGAGIDRRTLYASVLVLWSILVLASVAVAASTRLTVVVNVVMCSGFFVVSLLMDYFYGVADPEKASPVAAAVYNVVPNLQVFWVADLISADVPLPYGYLVMTGAYALCLLAAFLFLGMLLFQDRQLA